MFTLPDVPAQAAPTTDTPGRRRFVRRRPPARPRLWFELTLIASCYLAYTLIRNAIPQQATIAQAHAHSVWALEQSLGIAVEQSINHAMNSVTWLIVAMNYYYATLHFIVTLTVLVWLYRSRPGRYVVFRTVLMVATGIALIVFYLYPLAPPRLMTGGHFLDTVVLHHTWGSFATPSVASASNQFAAMPSMHFGWALWCGAAIVLSARRMWVRLLGALYPLLTLTVIISTGNHFWLDAFGGALTLAVAAAVALVLYYRLAPPPQRATPAHSHRAPPRRLSTAASA